MMRCVRVAAAAGCTHVRRWWLDGELSVEKVVLGDGERGSTLRSLKRGKVMSMVIDGEMVFGSGHGVCENEGGVARGGGLEYWWSSTENE